MRTFVVVYEAAKGYSLLEVTCWTEEAALEALKQRQGNKGYIAIAIFEGKMNQAKLV